MSTKNSNDTIGNRTRDLPTCRAVNYMRYDSIFLIYVWLKSIIRMVHIQNRDANIRV